MVPIHAKSGSIDTASPTSPTVNNTTTPSAAARNVRFHARTGSSAGPASPAPLSPTMSAKGYFDAPRTPRSVRGGSGGEMSGLARIASNSSVEAAAAGEEKEKEEKEKPKSHLDRMNELAKASREQRKVLDLEISNNSLLAINRALERKLRRQNAEIRRFRRLSRSGNLSKIADSFEMRKRGKKKRDSDSNGDADGDDDGEDDESSDELSSSEEEYTDSNSSGSDHSGSSRHRRHHHHRHGDESEDEHAGAHDAEAADSPPSSSLRAQKDTHRLMHDLSKHQQLLVSSQKLDDSIKRCLGRAESLLEEAKRSLDYTVGPAEVRGRVLNSDEVVGISAGGKGLLSSLVDIEGNDDVDDRDDDETETEVEIETDVSVMG
ncbi:hypothetical protein KEM56_001730 [Ascosphaera pollenicola]|nr:hypothetical protein KEM56_001730 [Ascosphaera pollenicola]